MEKIFLIDAYAIIYRSYYALIRSPRINSKGLNTSAIMGFCNTLNEVITKEQPTYVGVAFDHGKTFRHEAYPEYKAQREETPEDIRLSVPIIKDILRAWHIPVLQYDGFEADDIIGTLSSHVFSGSAAEDKTIFMLTPDKDYAQLVGENVFMYKPRHGGGYDILGEKEVCEKYTILSAKQVIDLLALMGDSADNFPGCPGVGEKTAIKLINEFGSCEELINRADEIKGALQKKVKEHTEDIRISKFLATIKTDIPEITSNYPTLLEQMRLQEPDADELTRIFDELEFRSLAQKILGKNVKQSSVKESNKDLKSVNVKKSKKNQTNVDGQLDLFGFFDEPTAETEEIVISSSINNVEHNYKLIDNLEDARLLCDEILTKQKVCFDTETTSISPIDAKLVGMSFSWEAHQGVYVSIPGKMAEAAEVMRPFFESEQIEKIGQNMKYDIEVLSNYNIEVRGVKRDTMIAHYLLQPELRHNMDYMAETMLSGYKTIHYDDIVGRGKTMADLQPSAVTDYACEDADITLQLWQLLEPRLHEQEGLWQLFTDIEMPLMEVLADMEMTGVALDTEALKEVSVLFGERIREHEQRIYELAGREFNISSPKQVGDILFGEMKIIDKPKKTKTGQFVTSEEVLQSLRGEHEIVAEILDYRGLKKLIGTYVDALPKLINPRTGCIHTSFNQCVTATGRLSSSDPNLQNIPVRGEDGKEIRKCIIAALPTTGENPAKPEAEEGKNLLFFSADYSQIELRVIAHLSQDKAMIEAFQNGWDVHAATAATVYHKERDEITRDERTKAKRANFGIIYGISAWGLAQNMQIERKEARQLMDGFFDTFPRVKEYMEESKERVRQTGYAATLLHRRRYLPDINSGNATVRGFAERNAINAPIQGTAADIIKIAMIRIFKRFREEGLRSKMILQVHDELNFAVVPEEREQVERIVIEEMQNAYPLSVPLLAESGWGTNWLEAH